MAVAFGGQKLCGDATFRAPKVAYTVKSAAIFFIKKGSKSAIVLLPFMLEENRYNESQMTTISATDALKEVLAMVREEPVEIQEDGKTVAVVLSIQAYQELKNDAFYSFSPQEEEEILQAAKESYNPENIVGTANNPEELQKLLDSLK